MVFPTLQFVLFFALVLGLNAAASRRLAWRNAVLIAASYVFYAAWDVRFLALIMFVTAIAWAAGLAQNDPRWARAAKIGAIVVMLGVLAACKYFNFFFVSLQQLLGDSVLSRDLAWLRIVLPVGISFYVFQAISYVMDVSRGEAAARRNPGDVALYISFFPQLVAGPIVRAADFLPQIDRVIRPDAAMRAGAVVLILSGLFKKMVVANYLSVLLVDPVFGFPEMQNAAGALLGVVGYAVQIYCDFSGYSDIAIGVALLLGFRFRRNFNQPYRATSLRDFWRRWHISLSSWIRDYLYIPLGGNRGGAVRRTAVTLTTMTLAGLWHGAGWTFILWGALHGLGIAVERRLALLQFRRPALVAGAVVFAFVTLLWIPFRAGSIQTTLEVLAAFTRSQGISPVPLPVSVLVLLALGLAMNWLPVGWRDRVEVRLSGWPPMAQAGVLATGTAIMFATAQEGVAPFIYFQF
ncbi:MAG: MBOAT family protein [Rhodobacteraceae bacterium]|nr:MBOAT family protein [Paracoccaceae bacterium]